MTAKTIYLCALGLIASLAFTGLASSAELVQLPIPAPADIAGQDAQRHCAAIGFNADSTIAGACRTATSTACSGRGCQPVTTITGYVAAWDAAGNPVSATACSVTRHHLPQADMTTYAPGYGPLNCPPVKYQTPTVVSIDGVPYWYVSTDPASGAELVNSNSAGFVYLP